MQNIHGQFTVAFYQILYWQDIPSQVKAWDDFDEVKIELGLNLSPSSTNRRKRKA